MDKMKGKPQKNEEKDKEDSYTIEMPHHILHVPLLYIEYIDLYMICKIYLIGFEIVSWDVSLKL